MMQRLLALLFTLFACGTSQADAITDTLRIVPPESGLVFVLHDLRHHGAEIKGSQFWKWFQQTPFGKEFLNRPELVPLHDLDDALKLHFETTLTELRDDVLGDLVVFAYHPGDGKSREQGLLLIQPRKVELLQKLIKKLGTFQEKTHASRRYSERVKSEKDGVREADYWAIHEGVFLYSSEEAAIKAALSRLDRLAEERGNPLVQAWEQQAKAPPMLLAWMNPRVFDAEFKSNLADNKLNASEKVFLTHFAKLWQSVDSMSFAMHRTESLELRLEANYTPTKLPKELAPWLAEREAPKWNVIPDGALVAVQSNAKLEPLLTAISGFVSSPNEPLFEKLQEQLGPLVGKDRFAKILANLGPNWSFWVDSPTAGNPHWLPEFTLAIQLGESKIPSPEVTRGLGQLLDFTAHQARLQFNRTQKEQMDFLEETQQGITIKQLVSDKGLPPGFRPSYGFRDNFLVLASRPERVRSFTIKPAGSSKVLATVSAERIQAFLATHADKMGPELAEWQKRSSVDVKGELRGLADLVSLFKNLELSQHHEEGRVHFRLKVELAKSLQKE